MTSYATAIDLTPDGPPQIPTIDIIEYTTSGYRLFKTRLLRPGEQFNDDDRELVWRQGYRDEIHRGLTLFAKYEGISLWTGNAGGKLESHPSGRFGWFAGVAPGEVTLHRIDLRNMVYCVCRQRMRSTSGPVNDMMGCIICGDFFHPECLGIAPGVMEAGRSYICPACEKDGEVLGTPVAACLGPSLWSMLSVARFGRATQTTDGLTSNGSRSLQVTDHTNSAGVAARLPNGMVPPVGYGRMLSSTHPTVESFQDAAARSTLRTRVNAVQQVTSNQMPAGAIPKMSIETDPASSYGDMSLTEAQKAHLMRLGIRDPGVDKEKSYNFSGSVHEITDIETPEWLDQQPERYKKRKLEGPAAADTRTPQARMGALLESAAARDAEIAGMVASMPHGADRSSFARQGLVLPMPLPQNQTFEKKRTQLEKKEISSTGYSSKPVVPAMPAPPQKRDHDSMTAAPSSSVNVLPNEKYTTQELARSAWEYDYTDVLTDFVTFQPLQVEVFTLQSLPAEIIVLPQELMPLAQHQGYNAARDGPLLRLAENPDEYSVWTGRNTFCDPNRVSMQPYPTERMHKMPEQRYTPSAVVRGTQEPASVEAGGSMAHFPAPQQVAPGGMPSTMSVSWLMQQARQSKERRAKGQGQ